MQPFKIDRFNSQSNTTERQDLLERSVVNISRPVLHGLGHIVGEDIGNEAGLCTDYAFVDDIVLYLSGSHGLEGIIKGEDTDLSVDVAFEFSEPGVEETSIAVFDYTTSVPFSWKDSYSGWNGGGSAIVVNSDENTSLSVLRFPAQVQIKSRGGHINLLSAKIKRFCIGFYKTYRALERRFCRTKKNSPKSR